MATNLALNCTRAAHGESSQQYAAWLFAIIGLLLFALPQSLFAADKVAFVVGNSQYESVNDRLKNPANDATDIANQLKKMGYKTTLIVNATLKQMVNGLDASLADLSPKSTFVFYYAGHGIQLDSLNYLIPVDAQLSTRDLVKYQAFRIADALKKIDQSIAAQQIMIIDACRNDPFPKSYREAVQGLGREALHPSKDTLIMYAASANEVASDGVSKNGVFTEVLLQAMQQPNLTLPELMDDIKIQVRSKTQGKQNPYYEGSGLSRFMFLPASTPRKTPTTARPELAERDCADCPELITLEMRINQGAAKKMAIGKYEITKKQFTQFVEEQNYNIQNDGCYILENNIWIKDGGYSFLNPSFVQTEHHPATCISHDDAQQYIAWLNKKTGKKYRLPTRSEWESLAAAGKAQQFPTGDCIHSEQANFNSTLVKINDCSDPKKLYPQKTKLVGSYAPNGLGVFDLAGNVAEWTQSCSTESLGIMGFFLGQMTPQATVQPECRNKKIYLKGGSWLGSASALRVAATESAPPYMRRYSYGFRVVKDITTP